MALTAAVLVRRAPAARTDGEPAPRGWQVARIETVKGARTELLLT
jgi:hypothetical protein